MISNLIGKRNNKIRQEILRAVYEENLSMLRGRRPALRWRGHPLLRRILLCVAVCTLAIMMHDQYIESSLVPAEKSANFTSLAPYPTRRISAGLTPEMGNYYSLPGTDISSQGTAQLSEFSAFLNNPGNISFSRMLGLKIKTIMIDPGHGGAASGTVGKMGTMEKEITLDIAKRLRNHLMKGGRYHVLMTREDDSTVSLQKRVALTQEARADLFISVHLNYLPSKPINIIETYYFGPSTDEKTLKLAEKENAGSEYGLSDFKEVMERLGKKMKLQESKEFAESIQANLFLNSRKHSEKIQNYGIKRAPFVVLLGVDVPAVLAEVSCLSNDDEERELSSESHRENIAIYLAAGIFDYLKKGAHTHEAKR